MTSHASLSSLTACTFLSCKQTKVPFHCNFLCISNGESQGPALSCEITWGQSFRGSQIKAKSQVALSEGSYCKWKSTPKNTNSLHSYTVFVFMTWAQMWRIISAILSILFFSEFRCIKMCLTRLCLISLPWLIARFYLFMPGVKLYILVLKHIFLIFVNNVVKSDTDTKIMYLKLKLKRLMFSLFSWSKLIGHFACYTVLLHINANI